jgi:CSLREA domain-containing protein
MHRAALAWSLSALVSLALACTQTDMPTAPSDNESLALAKAPGGALVVNTLEDHDDGSCSPKDCTFREAIAHSLAGDLVTFSNKLSSGTILLDPAQGPPGVPGSLLLDHALTIQGPGPTNLTISGELGVPIFFITGTDISITGVSLSGGEGPAPGFFGAGIVTVLPGASAELTRTHIRDGVFPIWISHDGFLSITESAIHDNQSCIPCSGDPVILNEGNLILDRSSYHDNHGTIYNSDSDAFLFINRTTLSRNLAFSIRVDNGATRILSSTIAGNSGSGVPGEASGLNVFSLQSVWVSNSILVSEELACLDLSGTLESLGFNLYTETSGCPVDGEHDRVVPMEFLYSWVLERELAPNGGLTMTHALVPNSLALDAGSCPGSTVDQRGRSRPVDDPFAPNARDACDIGAFETQLPQDDPGNKKSSPPGQNK